MWFSQTRTTGPWLTKHSIVMMNYCHLRDWWDFRAPYVSEWSAFVMTGLQTGRYGAESFTLSICHGPIFLWSPFRYKKWPLNNRAWEPAFTFTPAPTLTSAEPKKSLCAGWGGGSLCSASTNLSASSRLWCLTDYTKAPAPSLESFFGSPRTNPCWPHRHSMPLGGPSHGYLFLSCPRTLPQPPPSPP